MSNRSTLENFNLKISQNISQEKLTVLVFVNEWEVFNQAVHEIFDGLKNNSDFSSKCNIHIIDIEKNYESAINYSVVIGPSVVLFWKGSQLRIKRKDYEEDTKYVGAAEIEQYQELLKTALQDSSKLVPVSCQ